MEHTAQHRAERSGAETTMSGRTRMWEKEGFEQASTSKIVTVAEPNVEKVTSEGTQRVERISHALMPFLCSCFYCTPSHVRFIQSEEIPFQSIIFIKNFPYTHDASLYMCHIGAVLASNDNNESELIHTIEMRREKSVSAQLTCEMKWVGVKWSEQERIFVSNFCSATHWELPQWFFSLSTRLLRWLWLGLAVALPFSAIFQCPSAAVPSLLHSAFLLVRRTPKLVYICTYLVVISLFNIVKGGQEQSRERLKSLELSNINICMNVLQWVVWKSRSSTDAASAAISYRHKFFSGGAELFVEAEKYFYMWMECGCEWEWRGKGD